MDKQRLLEIAGVQLNENDELVDEVAKYIVDDLIGSIGEVSDEAVEEEIELFLHHLRQRIKFHSTTTHYG